MNLTQLADSLPNGLHDAELHRWSVDYTARTAVLELEIWVATDHSPSELYRPARITLSDLEYFVVEPPDPKYPFRNAEPVTVDLSPEDEAFVPHAQPGAAFRIFVGEWNAFIHGAASGADVEWLGPAVARGS